MKSWVVERDVRTTSRSMITRGGSSHMPSHSQGAERRPECARVVSTAVLAEKRELPEAADRPSEICAPN
ncbi:MAG TPA: hypothetical protein VN408_17150 [Actinoplanes sp.]|nr:hypothetical protein [Actinoplanes sp.]